MSARHITLRGVEVHNLQKVDLEIPHRQLVVICGVSGSGKTSLALDTLYAEGQRRYIESFSAYTRQFLERLDKPAAERIDGIPPSIAVTHKSPSRSSRSTIGTATETHEYLRLLFARIGQLTCHSCSQMVNRDTSESAADVLTQLPAGTRYMISFVPSIGDEEPAESVITALQSDGYVRAIHNDTVCNLSGLSELSVNGNRDSWLHVVVDRLTSDSPEQRIRDSLETAFRNGDGRCLVFVLSNADPDNDPLATHARFHRKSLQTIDGRSYYRLGFSLKTICENCQIEYPKPEPQLFSFNSPLGACPTCEGFGNLIDLDMDLIVPEPQKSLKEGAIAPWNTPAYEHELQELLALAGDYDLPVDIPYQDLTESQRAIVMEGVPEREFGGLKGFFAWLERRKYKMHLRVFLSRWRSSRSCPDCHGARLRPEALAVRVGTQNLAEISALKIKEAIQYFSNLKLNERERTVGRMMLEQVQARLQYLDTVGVGYLTLDRPLKTLSGGEMQRVALTSALGSSLVNMLYVLDEPSVGLHPQDTEQLFVAVGQLRNRGNSVVVVEHEETFLRGADHIIEVGSGAGENGGQIVFEGNPEEMLKPGQSLTGDYLTGRRGSVAPERRRPTTHGKVRLTGARGNNLKNISVDFPLGVLCLVTGVSGAGKSTLIQDTLYPALCRRKRKDANKPLPYDDVFGDGQIDDLILVDQSPIGKSPRSNPVTYIKAFDAIRAVFADTLEARTHNYSAGHFSFNVDGGRCGACQGDGFVQIDMQFLADVYMKCSQCGGRRYRKEILDVTYRGKNIADVLEMSVRKAFSFFRGQEKVQTRLKRLMDVGLDYLRLGQPANTLSAGEAQRLKLAGYLASAKRNRTLFLLDEPTTGLHFSDIVKLLDCFEALLSVGHSLIIVEHNLQLMKTADYIIDLGPGAADQGGEVICQGTPEEVAENGQSATGRFLAEALAQDLRNREQVADSSL
ncbi:MAG: excinuclease ABC subunit UvrA [Planctomycetaceae bacterium]|nr:excinuclease ABC subunit UvrA [Planctomycetaceae bacterium]